MSNSNQNFLYPIFLKLDKVETLIVGGGLVGLEKLSFLLKSSPNANVTLVAPEILPEIEMLASVFSGVKLRYKKFSLDDLNGKRLAIIATEKKKLNQQIKAEAEAKGILANVADTPELCDFYLGSIITKGDLKIAVSTNGKSPTFAKRFREVMEEVLPDELSELIKNLDGIRKTLKGNFTEKVKILNRLTKELVNEKHRQEKEQILSNSNSENYLVFNI